MQTASGAFATMLASPDQTVVQRVLLTLPTNDANGNTIPTSYADVTDCIVSIKGDAAITTTTPENTLKISGYTAAGATMVLQGPLKQAAGVPTVEATSVYRLFNPHDTLSPLYRLPQHRTNMTVVMQEGRRVGGNAPEYVTVGTLIVDTVVCSNGTVTLTLIDGRNLVRGPVAFPPVITNSPFNAGLSSQFAVDHMFRHASPMQYLSRPARRTNCVLDVGFRDSIYPELGILPSRFQQGTPTFIPGVNGSALGFQPLWNILYQPVDPTSLQATSFAPADKMCGRLDSVGDAVNGFTVNLGDGTGAYQFFISRNITTGEIVVYTNSPGGFSAVTNVCTIAAGNHTVEWSASWASGSSTVSGTVWLDGVAHTFSFSAANTRPSGENFTLVSVQGPIEALQITKETAYATGYPFTPTLILDQSLNPLTALPDTTGKDVWTVGQELCAAEAAVINIDEVNVAHFTNRHTIAAKASALTLSSRVQLAGLDSQEQRSLVATHITQPINQLVIQPAGTIWEASTPIELPNFSTTTIYVNTSTPVLAPTPTDSGYYPDTGAVPGLSYWRASAAIDGSTGPVTGGIGFTVAQVSATLLAVTIINTNWFPVWLVSGTATGTTTPESTDTLSIGASVLIIGGQAVTSSASGVSADSQWPPANAGGAASNVDYGEILLPLSANDWVQDLGAAQSLTDHYLSDMHVPLPLYRNVKMISDPRIQQLDRLTLSDQDVSLAALDVLVVGSHFTYGGGQGQGDYWTRNLDVRAYWPPGALVLGVAGMSELGDGASVLGTAYAY